MTILMWNCRGALNPDFKRRIFEMVMNHCPSIMVITKTRVGGKRAEEIISGLPFDGFITTDTIGYADGLWVMWNKEDVDISLLALTEQEIHATMKILAGKDSQHHSEACDVNKNEETFCRQVDTNLAILAA
ncbi:uncharacterized protein LOC142614539 [Castanea sativa]|uniref:uncharacterized protein LOC142614539 n=1 Tax=Castanea sativa TaxID=21020 RepID=UPI003F651AD3